MNEGLKMTFRERLADWLTNGQLHMARHRMGWFADRMDEAHARLDRIAAEEKPTSNATVKRMARMARGEE